MTLPAEDLEILDRLGLDPVPCATRAPAAYWTGAPRLERRGEYWRDGLRQLPLVTRRRRDKALMVLVPEGRFRYGIDGADPAWGPAYSEWLDSFYVDVHPVTVARYGRFVEATGAAPPGEWERMRADPDRPVTFVTWDEAAAYCRWAGCWLPAEAEWEKAARGPAGWIFAWGDQPPVEPHPFAAAFRTDSGPVDGLAMLLRRVARGETSDPVPLPPPVGRFPEYASPFGMEDSVGTVYQWCADPVRSSGPDPGSERRAVRGAPSGAVGNDLMLARRTHRSPFLGLASARGSDLGFRGAVRIHGQVDRVGY